MSSNEIARALFGFSADIQSRVRASDWPSGWEWRMHPGTWIRVKVDTETARYITMNTSNSVSATDDLLGCPVVVDADLPVGMVEFRYAQQMMLPMA